MKGRTIVWMLVISLGAKAAERTIEVCVEAPGNLVIHQARALAADMFKTIGIQIKWRCAARRDNGIQIKLTTNRLGTEFPGALAYARPYEGVHIEIFYDRVQQTVDKRVVHNLLAHVFAHEIAHMVEGTVRHSDSGVMKAKWDGADYAHMKWRPLPFRAEDAQLIRCGLDKRLQRPCFPER